MKTQRFASTAIFASAAMLLIGFTSFCDQANAQTDVVAFWHFAGFDFTTEVAAADAANLPAKFAVGADVDNTVGSASLEAFLGNAGNLDGNGGGGFRGYTSPVSGESIGETRTIRFEDSAGGGDDFFVGTDVNNNQFTIDTNDGMGPQENQDFGNDALIYLSLDGTGFEDFQLRFDLEGTPDDPLVPETQLLPTSYDIFFRTTGEGGTWFRESFQNNLDLTAFPVDPDNPDNQILDTGGFVSLASALNNAPSIEIIINDFNGNEELEFDNLEIVANAIPVPEPGAVGLIAIAGIVVAGRRKRSSGC